MAVQFTFKRASALIAAAILLALIAGGALPAAAGASSAAAPAPSWSPTAASVPAGALGGATAGGDVKALTCPAPGYCVAVGAYRVKSGTAPLAERYAGGTWTRLTVPLPANVGTGGFGRLAQVACSAPASCVAVGSYVATTGATSGLIEQLSGAVWTASEAPEPPSSGTGVNHTISLDAVACPAAGSCVVTGYFEKSTGTTTGSTALIETQAGSAWTPSAVPLPSGAGTGATATALLESVACPSVGSCVAMGYYRLPKSAGYPGLVDTLSGGTWTATAAPSPPGAPTTATKITFTITSVACPAVGSCTAVGQFHNSTGRAVGLIETLSGGGTWTATAAPQPTTAATGTKQDARLTDVSCPTPGSCSAVGVYTDVTATTRGLVDTLSGGVWVGVATPVPADAGTLTGSHSKLTVVACTAPGACVAVGTYHNATGRTTGLIDTLSGGTWSSMAPPVPSTAATGNAATSALYAVSCTAGGCAAGGYYRDATLGNRGLLDTSGLAPSGYFEAASDGGIFSFTVPFHGSMGGKALNAPIVSSAADPSTGGYWEVASDGGIFAFTAPFHGSMGGKALNKPVVGMAYDTRTGGYYEVASDGGIFAFTAPFLGSMGGKPLNQPIVGMAFDPSTGGYWEVASDGGIFAFTAPFLGSMGAKPLNKPVVGMAYDTLTGGYYLVASDGGLFAFTAPFHGSMGGKPLNQPVVGMAFDYGTGGYWEVASDGGLFAFTAPFLGSMGGKPLNKPMVTMATG